MENINPQELLRFIAEAHRNTYAAPKEIKKQHRMETPFLPGHKCYHFTNGKFDYYDGYAGEVWAPGREVVLVNNVTPVWAMSYQGQHNEDYSEEFFQNEVFPFLKQALRNMDDSMPFRGPSQFKDGDFEYVFQMDGDYKYFTGRETISYKGLDVFFQNVMGQLIR